MTIDIVTIEVSQQVAPAPSTLQKTGAFVTQGGTNIQAGTNMLLTQFGDLTSILNPAININSITWLSNLVTVTLATPHGIPNGATVPITIAGVTPSGYNGNFQGTSTGSNTVTYPLVSNPGSETVLGTFILGAVAELVAMATTFFDQGTGASVYVHELGAGSTAAGVTALEAYIADPVVQFYSYLLPAEWANESTAVTMAMQQTALTAKTYFFVTCSLSNYTDWTGPKSVIAMVQSPDAPSSEFSLAAFFYVTLNYNPSNVNMITPSAFAYLFAVTAYSGLTNSQKTALKADGINWVATGSEGGISNTLIKFGTTADGRDFTYWYSVDWLQIQEHQALAAAIINGSNNPQNPLYYNQAGINRLKAVAQGVVNSGISFGLINGAPEVQAIPFVTYVAANPNDFPAGIYNGLSVTFTPNRGFISITFFITVSDLAAA